MFHRYPTRTSRNHRGSSSTSCHFAQNFTGNVLSIFVAIVCFAAPFGNVPLLAAEPAPSVSSAAAEGPKLPPVDPPSAKQVEASIDRAIAFLLQVQNKNGSWGSARNTKQLNIYAPVPGAHHAFRAGVTSLCISALIESRRESPEVLAALDRAEAWMFEHLPNLRRATPRALYNVWGHSYGIQALVRMHDRKPDDPQRQKKIKKMIAQQIDLLTRYASVNGGWGYYDFDIGAKQPASSPTSFTTATALVALAEARDLGVEVPQRLSSRAVESVLRQRKPNCTYAYGEYLKMKPMRGINRPGGSLGRSQACNVALRLWGDEQITDEIVAAWLDRLYARNGWLDIGRKRPVPHESWFQVAGYFFYYAHYYGALAIEQLPEDQRRERQSHLAHLMLKLQEKDGSWWDYPLYNYHQQYGTAFGIMSMVRCR